MYLLVTPVTRSSSIPDICEKIKEVIITIRCRGLMYCTGERQRQNKTLEFPGTENGAGSIPPTTEGSIAKEE